MNKPIVGITMGDPAGSGPEITIKALADPEQYSYCRPIVVGDVKVMEQAKKFVGREDIVIHRCEKVSDALFTPGTIDVLHLDLIEDISKFEIAKVSVEGGNAAFQCVKKVIELAMAGEVDATCTNALNKEAMNKALEYYHGEKSDGYTHFDGHTEIYATYTHTKKYTMMLAHHDLRVVHVSTHVSLREACDRVKKDRVLEVIEIANKACKDMGIENPRIAVAGLNPHCGENGLFGREEIEEIAPAIEAAKAEGITGLAVGIILISGVMDFNEIRNSISAPIILMSAGVIGIADALGNTGLTSLVGETVAKMLGTNVNPFVLIFAFCILTSVLATLTGSTIGTVYVFAPMAIATCVNLGLDPTAAAAAIVVSGWCGHFLPIDGMPAMIMGAGDYKITEFWKFTIPQYFIRLLALTVGAVLIFPMK